MIHSGARGHLVLAACTSEALVKILMLKSKQGERRLALLFDVNSAPPVQFRHMCCAIMSVLAQHMSLFSGRRCCPVGQRTNQSVGPSLGDRSPGWGRVTFPVSSSQVNNCHLSFAHLPLPNLCMRGGSFHVMLCSFLNSAQIWKALFLALYRFFSFHSHLPFCLFAILLPSPDSQISTFR